MATGIYNQERVPENLKKQLALAVRSIQWSYAIFWSISPTQPGVLQWGDGYYNGDIKTRKTVQSIELNADQLGLQRSDQLKELYESLSAGESTPQARRPSAALSPEDLTDTEWYYLVCMSFVFNIGEGLPGRTLANGHPIWLCNAHHADSKIFSRSLLAKSASIQTVVCFPFLGGVVEVGVTEAVSEDQSLIQHIKTSFLKIPCSQVGQKSTTLGDVEPPCAAFDKEILDTKLVLAGCEELEVASPDDCSDDQHAEDSFMVEGINGGASQVQSWQFMDDGFSNCVYQSMNSSDSISQTIIDPANLDCVPNDEKANNHSLQAVEEECNHMKLTAMRLETEDLHYQNVLSSLLKTSHPLILGPHVQNSHQESSFVSWRRVGFAQSWKLKGEPQKLLKKILLEVPKMHAGELMDSPEDNSKKIGAYRPEADEIGSNHVLIERKRRERLNDRFSTLKKIVPSINKFDKVSILDETIDYIKDLERRVEELQSCRESKEAITTTKRKPQDATERTSDNYGSNKFGIVKKPLVNKRKACDIDETEQDIGFYNIPKDGPADNVTINMTDKELVVKVKCPWREGALLEIMDAASNLHLDTHSVQSSTADGILSLTIKSKQKGVSVSARTIKQTLQRVAAWKS